MGHLRLSDRNQIEILLGRGCKQKEIADVLGKHASTISKEISENRRKIRKVGGTINGKYEAKIAQLKSDNKRRNSKYQCMKIEENHRIREYVIEHLKLHWSPEQIQGKIKIDKGYIISFKTIYTWLYKGLGQRYCKYLLCLQQDSSRRCFLERWRFRTTNLPRCRFTSTNRSCEREVLQQPYLQYS